jgi:threonine aldolase
MRAAMAAAPVGDDQYGEDPSTNRPCVWPRCWAAGRAVAVPTGTKANQVALRTLTRPGDEVVACRDRMPRARAGGAAANAGVQIHEIDTPACHRRRAARRR